MDETGGQQRGSEPRRLSYPAPLYVVAVPLEAYALTEQSPFVEDFPLGTFDEDLLPALPGIWYAMHLPKSRFETVDLPLEGVRDQTNGSRSHAIALIPEDLLKNLDLMERLVAPYEPALIIASSASLRLAQEVHATFRFLLPPVDFEDLNQSLLNEHWIRLAKIWAMDEIPGITVDATAPLWSWPVPPDGSHLSLQRICRMMGTPLTELPDFQSPFHSAAEVRHARVLLETLVSLERGGYDETSAADAYPAAFRRAANTTRVRLSLSLGGTSPRYKKLAAAHAESLDAVFEDKYPDVNTILVTHAALADDSMGLVLDDVLTPEMFHCLTELETHWKNSANPKAVRRIMARLNKASEHIWIEPLVAAIRCASSIDAFTDFPLGLLTMPGDTSPLSTRIPISYRAVNPLTRALQLELSPQIPRDLSQGFRVLIAECISDQDPVGQLSRGAWKMVEQEMNSSDVNIEVVTVEALTRETFKRAVADARPDVLVLSAHGFSLEDSNLAGVMIGDEPSLGEDLGPMPPLVVLSACHTSPRGAGAVNAGDLLLRAGAEAVLSTLVPVDVRHNSQLVSRFFRYLALAAAGEPGHQTNSVSEVWHEVQGLNVIIDLIYGNDRLTDWAMSGSTQSSPIGRFMSGPHGLRKGHIYADAEARLIGIAAETGEADRVRSWLRTPGYLPESLMYSMLGRPQNLKFEGGRVCCTDR
ncbi:CHAT domain-containing protein [Gulosibacter sediminis]|uniref:CHAT domain-containing protein n=1 Tax=Gulosibacter sediminis TaxID=1729695 RepID=UPI0024AD82FA|nr:CHAT domain-containing protein [Gulosibacter sediminis]